MDVIRNSVVLPCTPQQAFDFLSDLRNELEWNPKCQAMEKLTDGSAGVGTRYRAKWKGSPVVELDTVAFDPPRTWTMHNGGPLEVTFTGRLVEVLEGTRLDVEFEPKAHGWFRVIFPLFKIVLERDEQTNMGHIKTAVERRLHNPVGNG